MHQSSYDKMEVFCEKYLKDKAEKPLSILDLGSLDINGSYRPIFDQYQWEYRGMDMSAGKNVDIVLKTPYHWKEVKSDSTDVMVTGQAFEHIEYFWITILEIARVLKPGGICCILAPSGGYEHRYPVDCWRFYPDGFKALARFARLDVIESKAQWDVDPRYTDSSNDWKDCMLVCKKPILQGAGAWIETVRRFVLHHLLIYGLSPDRNHESKKS